MPPNIQPFRIGDMEAVDGILRAAFKTAYGRKGNLKRYLEIRSSGAFVARIDGEIVGFGAAMDYGPFAYIGKMGVNPKFQRRGVGGSILTAILEWLEERSCPTALLDASPYGGPLYEKFGFLETDLTAVMRQRNVARDRSAKEQHNLYRLETGVLELSKLLSFDMPRFGADRSELLHSYFQDDPSRFLVSHDQSGQVDGFLVSQPRIIGPWVASNPKVAEELLNRALELAFTENPTVFVSVSNQAALGLLSQGGFEQERTQRHMYRGKPVQRNRRNSIYGQANFSFG
jgi:ribosomal protein S18 acetylase RimI-like enzyme